MAYVQCDVEEGLRPSEATVGVHGLDGSTQFLRVERDFLTQTEGKFYLPIGIVYRDKDEANGKVLIEFPHPADSGRYRVWVAESSIYEPKREPRGAAV